MTNISPYTNQQTDFSGKEKEKKLNQRLIRLKTVVFISIIASGALFLAGYAIRQKKEVMNQATLAKQNALQSLLQQKMAIEQRNIADSNKEEALQQRELAMENERTFLFQKSVADSETMKAEANRLEALRQQYLAEEQRINAEKQKTIAETNAQEAIKQQVVAEEQRSIAKEEKQTSNKLKELADSRALANESIFLLNENLLDSGKNKALLAYELNKANNGPLQNNDIYNALNINWAKSINNKNQSGIHKLPVHCITGMPNNNIVFTADESGLLYESVIKDNGLQKIALYNIKEEVTALSAAPGGNKLVALTASGNCVVFTVSSSTISVLTSFKFLGTGRAVAFSGNEQLILLSSKGIGRYNAANIADQAFLNYDGFNDFKIGSSGTLYIASGNQVKIYKNWDELANNYSPVILKFDSRITSLAVDGNEHYIATGTYNGFVWINDLKTNNFIWNKALHLSKVNDLKFSSIYNSIIQLASAGADQTIKLINVTSILQKNYTEDVLILKAHNKWIYALYYTPDGQWLLSAGEDNKVIAWRPNTRYLYQSLANK